MKTREVRKERIPISGVRDIFNTSKYSIPDTLHACWVNDYNVDRFLDAGYEFWTGQSGTQAGDKRIDSDTQIGSRVSKNVGNGVTGFLMVVPKEIWEEDQKSQNREVDEKESIMHRQIKSGEGRYGKVTIDHGSEKK